MVETLDNIGVEWIDVEGQTDTNDLIENHIQVKINANDKIDSKNILSSIMSEHNHINDSLELNKDKKGDNKSESSKDKDDSNKILNQSKFMNIMNIMSSNEQKKSENVNDVNSNVILNSEKEEEVKKEKEESLIQLNNESNLNNGNQDLNGNTILKQPLTNFDFNSLFQIQSNFNCGSNLSNNQMMNFSIFNQMMSTDLVKTQNTNN